MFGNVYMEYVKPFLIGGAVIGGSKAASKLMGPALAPLVGGMPTGIIASFFLKGDDKKRKYFEGYAYSSFTLFLAILFIHLATMHFQKVSVNIISGISFIIWGVISYFVIKMRTKKGKKGKKGKKKKKHTGKKKKRRR